MRTNANRIKFIGIINNDNANMIPHCGAVSGDNCNTAPPNVTHNTVAAITPTATIINIGFVRIRANRLNPSTRTQNPFTIAIITNKANRAESTKSENTDWAHQSYIYLAQIMNMNKNYEQGRTYARRAYELDKSNGEPFIIIGQLYAASAKDCGTGDFYSKTAFWAAVDQFEKAKLIDPSLKDKANELINAYVHYFPTIESIFFNGFEEGQDFTIEGCWINETTKVRAAKTE